jgi:hypothetical protein
LGADLLIHPYDNSKGVGLIAFAFALLDPNKPPKALTLVVTNAGNTDRLQLLLIDDAGKATVLGQVSLGAGIAQNTWYQLAMEIVPNGPQFGVSSGLIVPIKVTGRVFQHATSDPDFPLGPQVGATLQYANSFLFPNSTTVGRVGIVARATSASVDSSVTNFCACADLPGGGPFQNPT